MNNKPLIKKRFSKSISSYNENAVVQRQMAQKLISIVRNHFGSDFENIFEIGCGAGNLTQLICQNIHYHSFFANDLVSECETCLKSFSDDIIFCEGDIESINFPQNLNLIISNATFQWVNDLDYLLKKNSASLKENGVLCFSTFGEENFKEILETTGFGLEYLPFQAVKKLCEKYFNIVEISQELVLLNFGTPLDVLKHIKSTGTNGLSYKRWTKSDFVEFEKKYPKTDAGCVLTYHPIYVLMQKK